VALSAEVWVAIAIPAAAALAAAVRAWFAINEKVDKLTGDVRQLSMKIVENQKENTRLRDEATKEAQRRHHNVCVALLLICSDARDKEVCQVVMER
jgi:outer membrane murein-binding lipoprotein Lpp